MKDKEIELSLLEYFRHKDMSIEERNIVITFLYKTKEFEDNPDMKIVSCNFKKVKENIYKANGMISSELSENRCFEAYIDIQDDKISIKSDIVKLCSEDINREFSEYSVFTRINDQVYNRKTKYSHVDVAYESNIVIDNYDIIYQDFSNKEKK